jgi:hypothetical protein
MRVVGDATQNGGAHSEFLTLDELSKRLQLSPRVVKRLHRERGLPIWRLTPRGPLCAFWSDVEKWLHAQRPRKLSSGKSVP